MSFKSTLPAIGSFTSSLTPSLTSLALIASLLVTPPAQALGLGAIQSQSALGQALRLTIPVQTQAGEEVDCVRVSAGGDDLPAVANMRASVLRKGASTLLEITTRQSVHEPALGLKVTVGCTTVITRQYVLLLDPPQDAELAQAPAALVEPASSASAGRTFASRSAASGASPSPVRVRKKAGRSSRPAALPALTAPVGVVPQTLPAAREQTRPGKVPGKLPSGKSTEADHVILSNQVEGPSLRLNADLLKAPASQAPVGQTEAAKLLQQGQAQMAAALEDKDPLAQMTAREADLNQRIQRLNEQALQLQKQIDALSLRNRTLEQTSLPSYVAWLLGILVLLALTLGSWFMWRYRVLKQTLDGQPWWSANAEPPVTEAPTIVPTMGPVMEPMKSPAVAAAPSARTPQSAVKPITKVASKPTAAARPAPPRPATQPKPAIGSVRARLDTQALTPMANSTATDIGGLSQGAHAMELTEHEAFDATQSSFERLVSSQIASATTTRADTGTKRQTPPASATAVPATPQGPVDLDITTAGIERPIGNQLDFSLATDVAAPAPAATTTAPPTAPMQEVTESFFMGIRTEPGGNAAPPPNPHFLHEHDEHNPITTEPLRPVAEQFDLSSLHVRLVQYTSVLEQIEEMIRRDDSTHAIELLRGYVLHEENMPTLMWLLLLDQYRKTGKKSVFESLAQHFSRRYNRAAPRWDQTWADRAPQLSLGQMPAVDDGLKILWGTHKGLEQIERLICGTDQSDAIVFNTLLQRELLQLAPMYPMDKLTKI